MAVMYNGLMCLNAPNVMADVTWRNTIIILISAFLKRCLHPDNNMQDITTLWSKNDGKSNKMWRNGCKSWDWLSRWDLWTFIEQSAEFVAKNCNDNVNIAIKDRSELQICLAAVIAPLLSLLTSKTVKCYRVLHKLKSKGCCSANRATIIECSAPICRLNMPIR